MWRRDRSRGGAAKKAAKEATLERRRAINRARSAQDDAVAHSEASISAAAAAKQAKETYLRRARQSDAMLDFFSLHLCPGKPLNESVKRLLKTLATLPEAQATAEVDAFNQRLLHAHANK